MTNFIKNMQITELRNESHDITTDLKQIKKL